MRTRSCLGLLLIGWLLLVPFEVAFGVESACVRCHTDEGTLKTLFTPPAPSDAEGEG